MLEEEKRKERMQSKEEDVPIDLAHPEHFCLQYFDICSLVTDGQVSGEVTVLGSTGLLLHVLNLRLSLALAGSPYRPHLPAW